MIALFPAWVTALASHNFSYEMAFNSLSGFNLKGPDEGKNTCWWIIVLRKGHAFEMNEAKWGWGGGGLEERLAIKLWAAWGGARDASGGIKSAFRQVNVTCHQRFMEENAVRGAGAVWREEGRASWFQAAVVPHLIAQI